MFKKKDKVIDLKKRKKGILIFIGCVVLIIVVNVGGFIYSLIRTVDYSKYDFVDIDWEYGIDIIHFGSDGDFSYYDNSGDPVDGYDLCYRYTYNSLTRVINLSCVPLIYYGPTKIKIVEHNDDTLKLMIGLKVIEFEKGMQLYEYGFADINWVGDDGTIQFDFDDGGMILYYDDDGAPIDGYSSCKSVMYDENNNIIRLASCGDNFKGVNEIKVVSFSYKMLKLDFDGELKEFKRKSIDD